MKKSYSHLAALLVLVGLLLAGSSGWAQVFDPTAPAVMPADTAERRDVVMTPEAKRSKAAADSAKRTERMFRAFGYEGIRLTRPGKAALLSAVLPGAGQIYNRRWWKLPLVYGGLGGVVAFEWFYQMRYREFADASNDVKAGKKQLFDEDLGPQAKLQRSVAALDAGVIAYRGRRDLFILYVGLAYTLQVVDALVDAHLRDFDVNEDLTFHWEPTLLAVPGQALALPTNPGVMFALRVK